MGYSGVGTGTSSGALDELLSNLVSVVAVRTIVTKRVAGQKALKIEGETY